MEIAAIPSNEKGRLDALLSYDILDSDFEQEYQEIVNLASLICGTPIALISLVDSQRQWFKAKVGLDTDETSRDVAFCSHAIDIEDILVINDAFEDNRFFDNPLVIQEPNIRFYAGAQLRNSDGYVLGTLCAIDRVPRELTKDQLQALETLAKQVIARLELRKSYKELQNFTTHLNTQNIHKDKLFKVISHDLRSPFSSIIGFTEMLHEDAETLTKNEIKEMASNIMNTANSTYGLVNNLLNWSLLQSGIESRESQLIDLDEIVNKILSVLAGLILQKNITITKQIEPASKIFSNYDILFSSIQNVVSNAIKFTPHSGHIVIMIKNTSGDTNIIVTDSGIGMSQDAIETLLNGEELISQSGTDGEEGSGIGFGIAKDFVEILGGNIKINSNVQSGTQVHIKLPNLQKN